MVGTTLWTSPIWLLGTVQGKERCRNYPTGLYWLWPQSKLAPTKEGCMADSLHPAASHHLPLFITAPGETDVLMVVMGVILVLAVLMFGILFFRLHSLPERMAHKSHKIQMEIVAVLCLISLFTHMHIFWIAALLLAIIDIPDFGTALRRIAGSAEKIAGIRPGEGADELAADNVIAAKQAAEAAQVQPDGPGRSGQVGGSAALSKPEGGPAIKKELSHA